MKPLLTGITVVAAAWAGWIAMTGGGRFSLFGLTITATDPYRPLGVAAAAFVLRIILGGRHGVGQDFGRLTTALPPSSLRWILIVAVVLAGYSGGSGVGGGADSYGYLSQADLWLKGDLITKQPGAARAPWPDAQSTLAPLGYRPSPSRDAIVPIYSPGFPLLLAAFKAVGGHCVIRWVVPLAAALLVAVTFALGSRTASAAVGAAASLLLVTSPVFLNMLMSPMSDIPAAAFWALALYGCLIGSRPGALLGGMAAAVAILIRPNLVHVGVMMGLWLVARDLRAAGLRARVARVVLFSLPLVPACLAVAAINTHLYGSPTSSGYGNLGGLFDVRHFVPNVINYGRWMIETQTPLAVLGLVALWIPGSGKSLFGLVSLAVVGTYLFYLPFDAWWYLRFLLPCWPAVCIGSACLLARRSTGDFGPGAKLVLLCVGLYGVWYAHHMGAFNIGRNELRYVKVARLVRQMTEPDSVIISLQHSGSVRYYGERATLRYENLNDRWLDTAIEWLRDNGSHPYILLDDAEHDTFKGQFSRRNTAGRLDIAMVFEYRDRYGASTLLYDPLQASKLSRQPMIVAAPRTERLTVCLPPAAPPTQFPFR